MKVRAGLLAAALIASIALPAVADTLKTTDGRVFEGKVVSRDAGKVVFDVRRGSSTLQMEFKTSEVADIKLGELPAMTPAPTPLATPKPMPASGPSTQASKPAYSAAGNTYFIIPIRDTVGTYVTADLLTKTFTDVDRIKPAVVVLEVDSPGGHIDEAEKIIAVLNKNKDKRIVAYVTGQGSPTGKGSGTGRAISAAAIITIGCKEIYLDERATIGGALAYRMTAWGMPAEINEKMQSIWRATCRSAAELGGHQPLLAEAMVDQDISIRIVQKDGKPAVEEGMGTTMLKRKGKLLTMTAKESVDCGLANGIAKDYAELADKLGMSGWTKAGKQGETAYDNFKKDLDSAIKEVERLINIYNDEANKASFSLTGQEQAGHYGNCAIAVKKALDLNKKFPQLKLNETEMEELLRRANSDRDAASRR